METCEKHSGRYPWGSSIWEAANPNIPVNTNASELKNINDVLMSMDNNHNATYNTLKMILYILTNTDPNKFPPIINDESESAGILGQISRQETKARFINDLINEIARLLGAEVD